MQANLLLLITAAIWGFGFVAQRLGMNYLEPFAFNGVRFLVGSLSLVPLLYLLRKRRSEDQSIQRDLKAALIPGLVAGGFLFIAASLQQWGLTQTSATKAGFITGLYIVIVPFLGIFLAHRISRFTWAGALLALLGLYLLSFNQEEQFSKSDGLVLLGALFWAIHLLLLDYYTKKCNALPLAAIQFFVCGLMACGVSLFYETTTLAALVSCWKPIAYAGLVSVGIAYTLQVVAQKSAEPTQAAIIMSLEAAFAAVGGVWLLGEWLSVQAWIGCGLMLAGMVVSQIPERKT